MYRNFHTLAIIGSILFANLSAAGDTDWPQWRGPNRDGHAAPQELLQSWPPDGPKLIWSYEEAGAGYSTVSVADGRIYTMGEDEKSCFALCIDATDGTKIWKQSFSRPGAEGDYNRNFGYGPRSTPTVDGDRLFVFSETGTLASLDRASGKVLWKIDVVADHGGEIPVWGYSESPLVDGDRVLVTPGKSNFMIAVDRLTGKKIWNSKGVDTPAHYASIVQGTAGTTSYYVTASGPGLLAFDTKTGRSLFADIATGNDVAVIPTPIVIGDRLYHTSDYGAGNTLLKLSSAGAGTVTAETVYHEKRKTMRNKHGGVVLVDGTIYGFTQAFGGSWMAQDLETGELLWKEKIRPNTSGSICYADGHLYCYNDIDAAVNLVQPSRDGWISKGKLTLPKQTKIPRESGAIWSHPIVADGMLILRDHDLIFAFDIAK